MAPPPFGSEMCCAGVVALLLIVAPQYPGAAGAQEGQWVLDSNERVAAGKGGRVDVVRSERLTQLVTVRTEPDGAVVEQRRMLRQDALDREVDRVFMDRPFRDPTGE